MLRPDPKRFNLPENRVVLKNLDSLILSLAPHPDSEVFLFNILDRVKDSANPEQALNYLEQFLHQADPTGPIFPLLRNDRSALRILCTLLGASPYLSLILIRDPDLLLWLTQNRIWNAPLNRRNLLDEILTGCKEITDIREAYRLLRQVKKREMLRIGARDLTGFSEVTETTETLTILAEATLEAAYRLSERHLRSRYGPPLVQNESGSVHECRFTILGMGKLGGEELNYSSDVDLLYLYESDNGETGGVSDGAGGTQGKIALPVYYARLCEQITDMMSANTEDGFVFRVDLRLRPEGAQGPVASSLRSYELYYESFGRTWERAALLKCRPVAGDLALGREFNRMLKPFVYRKYFDYGAIEEIKEMKQKIGQTLRRKQVRGYNVKLGAGGIREIEFLVQSLQLFYGGRIPWVRERNSLRALHRLCSRQLITYEDYSALSRAYLFLRNVEHKIQIENQLQTQTLPTDPVKAGQLARRCGFASRETFRRELERHRDRVRDRFNQLLHGKEPTEMEEISPYQGVTRGVLEEKEAEQILTSAGFQNPRRALKNLRTLREGPPYAHTSSRGRTLFLKIAPFLLEKIVASPDPDMALAHLERFVTSYGVKETFYGLLNQNRTAVQSMISLFSMSGYLAGLLIRHPETVGVLFGEEPWQPIPSREALWKQLLEALDKQPSGPARIDFLRRFKHMEELKIGLRDILLNPEVPTTSRDLSRLADVCIRASCALARRDLTETYGPPGCPSGETPGFSVLAVGKLGSRELTYGADLDLLFVYSGDGECAGKKHLSNRDFFTRMGSRIISILSSLTGEGLAYRVDLRLRPLGEDGPLVQPLPGYIDYLEKNLQTWEKQALTRARFCAGDSAVAMKLMDRIEKILFHQAPNPNLKQEIFRMRMRIEREKARETGQALYFKTGAGGLVDIEFLIQYLQLQYGRKIPGLRFGDPLHVLHQARMYGILTESEKNHLKEAYLFLRKLENRARIAQDRPVTTLSPDPVKNRPLALRMGYSGETPSAPGETLLADYHRLTRRTRKIFLHLMGTEESGCEKY